MIPWLRGEGSRVRSEKCWRLSPALWKLRDGGWGAWYDSFHLFMFEIKHNNFFFFFFKFYFIFKLYITVLDLPNIKMNPPQTQ